jgi:RHS repeat-associated protein
VYFDDFQIAHTTTPIVQKDDYYPFGGTFNSYQRSTAKENKYLYNGKEKQDALGIDWLDYGARMYMPDIGRWGVVDPLSDKYPDWSPYNYAFNNPTNLIDPDGMEPQQQDPEKGKTTKTNKPQSSVPQMPQGLREGIENFKSTYSVRVAAHNALSSELNKSQNIYSDNHSQKNGAINNVITQNLSVDKDGNINLSFAGSSKEVKEILKEAGIEVGKEIGKDLAEKAVEKTLIKTFGKEAAKTLLKGATIITYFGVGDEQETGHKDEDVNKAAEKAWNQLLIDILSTQKKEEESEKYGYDN